MSNYSLCLLQFFFIPKLLSKFEYLAALEGAWKEVENV